MRWLKELMKKTTSLSLAGHVRGDRILAVELDELREEGCVFTYYLHDPVSHRMKIGRSADPLARRDRLQTGNPNRLVFAGLVRVDAFDDASERDMHRRFADQRVGREWFTDGGELRWFVFQLFNYCTVCCGHQFMDAADRCVGCDTGPPPSWRKALDEAGERLRKPRASGGDG